MDSEGLLSVRVGKIGESLAVRGFRGAEKKIELTRFNQPQHGHPAALLPFKLAVRVLGNAFKKVNIKPPDLASRGFEVIRLPRVPANAQAAVFNARGEFGAVAGIGRLRAFGDEIGSASC